MACEAELEPKEADVREGLDGHEERGGHGGDTDHRVGVDRVKKIRRRGAHLQPSKIYLLYHLLV